MIAPAQGPQLRHVGLNLLDSDEMEPGEAATGLYGFWLFLMSDAILFALLFAIYGRRSRPPPRAGPAGDAEARADLHRDADPAHQQPDLRARRDRLEIRQGRRGLVLWLCVTLALGIAFLASS